MTKVLLLLCIIFTFTFSEEEFKSASFCAECHETIHRNWLSSRHKKATVQEDELFAKMYEWAINDSEGKLKEKCIVCHSPMSTIFEDSNSSKSFNQDGVTCQFCHGVKEIKGYHSAKDLVVDLSTVYSHQPPTDNESHLNAHRDYFAKSDICLPCHAEMKNLKQIPVCSTGDEWHAYFQKHKKTCQDCHMPKNEKGVSHTFPGTHQGNLLKESVSMKLEFNKESSYLTILLTNIKAGHAIPTGTPLRMIILKVVVRNKEGNVLWENWKENPIKEDKTALFMKILGDASGKGPVPPWKATQVIFDRKLLPKKPIEINYNIPQKESATIEAKLFYRFAPPPILETLKITESHFIDPILITQKKINIRKSS